MGFVLQWMNVVVTLKEMGNCVKFLIQQNAMEFQDIILVYVVTTYGTCNCDSSLYYGVDCSLVWECNGIRYDDLEVCSSHGSCLKYSGCSCGYPFYGSNCSAIIECYGKGYDDHDVCSSHGTCTNSDFCICDYPYYGSNCSQVVKCSGLLFNDTNVCNQHGLCSNVDNCLCENGFAGDHGDDCVSKICNELNNSNPNVCNGKGWCLEDNLCYCDQDYYPDEFGNCILITNEYDEGILINSCCCGSECTTMNIDNLGFYSSCDVKWFKNNHGDNGRRYLLFDEHYFLVEQSYEITKFNYTNNVSVCVWGKATSKKTYAEIIHELAKKIIVSRETCESVPTSIDSFSSQLSNCQYGYYIGLSNSNDYRDMCYNQTHIVRYIYVRDQNNYRCREGFLERYEIVEIADCAIVCGTPNICFGKFDIDQNLYFQEIYYRKDYEQFLPCSNNGKCLNTNNCTCKEGYFGEDCSQYFCKGIEKRELNVCNGKGRCVAPDICICIENYAFTIDGECVSLPTPLDSKLGIVLGGFFKENLANIFWVQNNKCIYEENTHRYVYISMKDHIENSFISSCEKDCQKNCITYSFQEYIDKGYFSYINFIPNFNFFDSLMNYTTFLDNIDNIINKNINYSSTFSLYETKTCLDDPKFVFFTISTGISSYITYTCINSTDYAERTPYSVSQIYIKIGKCVNGMKIKCFNIVSCFGKEYPHACNSIGKCTGKDHCSCPLNYNGKECKNFTCYGKASNDTTVCSGKGKCIKADYCLCDGGLVGECNKCLENYDSQCESCISDKYDPAQNCVKCLGNLDEKFNCLKCKQGWKNLTKEDTLCTSPILTDNCINPNYTTLMIISITLFSSICIILITGTIILTFIIYQRRKRTKKKIEQLTQNDELQVIGEEKL